MNKIEVRLFASLRKYNAKPGDKEAMIIELDDKTSLGSLLGRLKIPPEEVTVIMVNGKREKESYSLRDGDRVGIFPLIGGG